jgi:hypothetical protein
VILWCLNLKNYYRKMYQETTHKLMIFRNALKERQVVRNLYNKSCDNNNNQDRRTPTIQSPTRQPNQTEVAVYRSKTPTNLAHSPHQNNSNTVYLRNHRRSPSSSSASNSTSTNTNSSSPNQSHAGNSAVVVPHHNTINRVASSGSSSMNQVVSNFTNLNELGLIVEEDSENMNMYEDENEEEAAVNQNNLNSGSSSDQVLLIDNNPNNYMSNNANARQQLQVRQGNFKSSSNSSSGSTYTGMMSKPIQSSTPTLSVHHPMFSDFTSRNAVIMNNKQSSIDSVNATRGTVDNTNRDAAGGVGGGGNANHDVIGIENLLYSSDEETLSDNDYDLKNEQNLDDEDDDDDFMNHNENNNKMDGDVYIQEDDNDDDLDDQDRRILNFTDSKNESSSNREIIVKSEAPKSRKTQPPPMPRRKFITIHDNTTSRVNPIHTVTRSDSLKTNNVNNGPSHNLVNNASRRNSEW